MAVRRLSLALLVSLITSMAVSAQLKRPADGNGTAGTVVLLHGLIRSPASMNKMAAALRQQGYATCNVGYPSTEHTVEQLAANFVLPDIKRCIANLPAKQPLHFVTHSMGGIIVRQLVAAGALDLVGRVVMLGPPNSGSELVDKLGGFWLFSAMNGPAGAQLVTGSDGFTSQLGAATFELGIIAGTQSFSPLSQLIPGDDDGKVSVERAKLDGMTDFITLPVTHTFMMRNSQVIQQTLHFLQRGKFQRPGDEHVEHWD